MSCLVVVQMTGAGSVTVQSYRCDESVSVSYEWWCELALASMTEGGMEEGVQDMIRKSPYDSISF